MNSGQHCQANSRVFVEDGILDQYLEKVTKLMQSRRIGDPFESGTWQGPQGDKLQHDRILSLIENGKNNGELCIGGKSAQVNGKVQIIISDATKPMLILCQGYWIEPTIFKNVKEDSEIFKEEIFGPVLLINTFKSEEDVIARANNTEYGLLGESCLPAGPLRG